MYVKYILAFFRIFLIILLRLFKLKTEGQTICRNLTVKILAYPGRA